MQEAKQRAKEAKEAKEADAAVRQPKYIKGLLKSAEPRRLDHLRAEEAMMQRARMRGDTLDNEAPSALTYADTASLSSGRIASKQRLVSAWNRLPATNHSSTSCFLHLVNA
ncbi:hypothetical protein BDV98DRAFT_607480 [Pterulicium gracile]|uniref:Nuclear speckle splicing regulatory protein 1 N-terminal domain-containing protein n=1 Tax=Pterulicium gracile TaxID=1884261 RepID=A0A5C3QH09_9AGAR|nr:hypothetical protein BDV98DRAFT_607480 [Pterula gracilis]